MVTTRLKNLNKLELATGRYPPALLDLIYSSLVVAVAVVHTLPVVVVPVDCLNVEIFL
jgi:hypothetical protein